MARKEFQFNVLDALSVAGLPRKHFIGAIASHLLDDGSGLMNCVEHAQQIAEIFADSPAEQDSLADEITLEIKRQVSVRVDRIRAKKLGNEGYLGSQLAPVSRINRVCSHIFGDGMNWRNTRSSQKVRSPHFNWFHKDGHGSRLAGFDAVVGDVSVTGVVVRSGDEIYFTLLPSRARSWRELVDYYKLGRRLHDDPGLSINWSEVVRYMRGSSGSPWVYP